MCTIVHILKIFIYHKICYYGVFFISFSGLRNMYHHKYSYIMFFYEYKAIIVIINTFVVFFTPLYSKRIFFIACFIPPFCILHTIKQNNGFINIFILFHRNEMKINKSGKLNSTEMNVKPLALISSLYFIFIC